METEISPGHKVLVDRLMVRIRHAVDIKDWQSLEQSAAQWLAIDPKNVSAFKWLARATLAQRQISRAAYAYGRILDLNPSNEEAHQFFATYPSVNSSVNSSIKTSGSRVALPSRQDLDTLEENFPTTLPRLGPKQRDLLSEKEIQLGLLYRSYNLFSEASECFRRAHHWNQSPQAALFLATSLHDHRRTREGAQFLRSELLREPQWIEGRLLLGRLLFESGRKADAQREWQEVLKQEPENSEALNWLRELMIGL